MRFLLVAALILIVILFAAVMAVRVIIALSLDNVSLPGGQNASSSGNAAIPSSSAPIASTSTIFIPSGFNGPTSPPKIIGPTANPPNY